jgi:small subunit ribosomal protein S13
MARIAWVNLPKGKHVWVALTYIYGIGKTTALNLCKKTGVNPNVKIETLSEDDLDKIRAEIKESINVEWDLRRLVQGNIKRLMEIRCYRGIRHRLRLPVRGQNTKTNARTRKWKSTAIANKKK